MRIASDNKKSMARKVMLNKTIIDGLTCPPGRRDVHVYDLKVPGLAYRLTANGARSWYLIRRMADGRSNRLKLGGRDLTVEQARNEATRYNAGIVDGVDHALERRTVRRSATLGELWEAYRSKHLEPRASAMTIRTDSSRWDTCFVDWTARKALSVNENDARDLHTQLGIAHGRTTANRALQLLRRMYNWARWPNPVKPKGIAWFNEVERERFVQPDELPKLFAALDAEETNPMVRDFVYLCLFTGARRSNVASMRADEINIAASTWIIPAGKSKNKKPMNVPLSVPALKIIKPRMNHPSGFIFPGDGRTGHLVEMKWTWQAVLERAGLKDLHLHDLRRTFGSFQAAAGASLSVIGASLGHQDHATTRIYARLNLDPVRASVGIATAAMLAAAKAKPKKGKKK
jgi:integrase